MARPRDDLSDSLLPLSGGAGDYDRLLEAIGYARLVLLGEASHGTHEFYRERAEITKQLIVEKGFSAVALEETGAEPLERFAEPAIEEVPETYAAAL